MAKEPTNDIALMSIVTYESHSYKKNKTRTIKKFKKDRKKSLKRLLTIK